MDRIEFPAVEPQRGCTPQDILILFAIFANCLLAVIDQQNPRDLCIDPQLLLMSDLPNAEAYVGQNEQDATLEIMQSLLSAQHRKGSRYWTIEEEITLLQALKFCGGFCPSQMIEQHGPHGRINTILKNRSESQLRTKRLYLIRIFASSEIETPNWLTKVHKK